MQGSHPVIFFDGQCALCNGFVRYVLRHDRKGLFRFSPLQSSYAQRLGLQIPTEADGSLSTMIVLWEGTQYRYADGVLKVLQHLGGLHILAVVFRIFPRCIRDTMYRWLARRRYAMFGRSDICMLPPSGTEMRFLK